MKTPLAIFTSDWHIWGRAPLWRAAEENWFAAQGRALKEIRRYQKRNGNIPVFIAGDIFDFYNPPPETVNWLLTQMPKNVYGIPGQHDLQNHVYELIEKTGFWTLVEAGAITFCDPEQDTFVEVNKTLLHIVSKPWEVKRSKPIKSSLADITIYLAHEYIFKDAATAYQGADKSHNISASKEILKDVDVAVYGDNHIPFIGKVGKTQVVNCGTLNRRKVDERFYEPGFVVLLDDLTLQRIKFDTSKDQFATILVTKDNTERQERRAEELLKELEELDTISIDFEEEVMKYLEEKGYDKTSIRLMTEIFTKYKEQTK